MNHTKRVGEGLYSGAELVAYQLSKRVRDGPFSARNSSFGADFLVDVRFLNAWHMQSSVAAVGETRARI
jgi:hypothetical protein